MPEPNREKPQRGSSPHCGHPGQLEIGWYSNRAGVLTVEHPVPKMDSGQLPDSGFVRIVDIGLTWHRMASSPNAPGSRSNCGLERRECQACQRVRPGLPARKRRPLLCRSARSRPPFRSFRGVLLSHYVSRHYERASTIVGSCPAAVIGVPRTGCIGHRPCAPA